MVPTHLTIILPKLAADLKHRDNPVTLLCWLLNSTHQSRLYNRELGPQEKKKYYRDEIFIQVFNFEFISQNLVTKVAVKKDEIL